jgi:hypothetical protein
MLKKVLPAGLAAVFFLITGAAGGCDFITGASAPETNYVAPGYPVKVWLPSGWASADNTLLMYHEEGLVAFNSWGETGFWALPEKKYSDGSGSVTYSPAIISSRVPPGGAYVSLVWLLTPPAGFELRWPWPPRKLDYQRHDWRTDASDEAVSLEMERHGKYLYLYIVCKSDASDETVTALNALLASWRFAD